MTPRLFAPAVTGNWARVTMMALLAVLISLVAVRYGDSSPVVGTVVLEQQPGAMAIDTRTGHTFITTVSAGESGHVLVLDTMTGVLLRTVAVGADPFALAVAERSGRVFVVNHDDSSVSVLDAYSGALLRTVMVSLLPHTVAVDERTGHAVVVGETGTVSLLDGRSGALLRTVTVGIAAWDVAVDERTGHAVVTAESDDRAGNVSGSVGVLDTASGRLLHSIAVDPNPRGVTLDEHRGRAFVINPDGSSVMMVDLKRSSLLHTTRLAQPACAVAVDERAGWLVIANGDGTVTLLDEATGRLLRTVGVGEPAGAAVDDQTARSTPPSCPGSTLGVPGASSATMLYTIAARSEPALVGVDERTSQVSVATGGTSGQGGMLVSKGSVRVLDARNGQILTTLPLGGDPIGIAVDERAGRAVVVTLGGIVRAPSTWWVQWTQWTQSLRRWLPWLPRPLPSNHTVVGSVSVLDSARL